MDVIRWSAMVRVSSLHGWPSIVPGLHLVFLGFSFEVGDGGGRVARGAFPFRSFFGKDIGAFVSLDVYMAWNPVDVGPDSSGDRSEERRVGKECQ